MDQRRALNRWETARTARRCIAVLGGLLIVQPLHADGPTITNVTAAQRGDLSKRVDIRYNLAATGPCTVWVVVSDNGGQSWTIPASRFTGDVGPNIQPGVNKAVVWDAPADIPGRVGTFKVRVYADDGAGANMVLVPAGDFPYQRGARVYVAAFLIDKYEVTNQRYAEYLNAADPNGDHYHVSMEISRSGTPPNVTYGVQTGKENFPIRYASALDAEAYAAWLSAREGRTYRLPTEQEWEKAAAWNSQSQRHWTYAFQSDAIDCTRCNYSGGAGCPGIPTEVGHYNGTSGTVDSKSFYGAYDMSGNVWEWTSTGGGTRVYRGGAWTYTSTFCTTVSRDTYSPDTRSHRIGFRFALDPN